MIAQIPQVSFEVFAPDLAVAPELDAGYLPGLYAPIHSALSHLQLSTDVADREEVQALSSQLGASCSSCWDHSCLYWLPRAHSNSMSALQPFQGAVVRFQGLLEGLQGPFEMSCWRSTSHPSMSARVAGAIEYPGVQNQFR